MDEGVCGGIMFCSPIYVVDVFIHTIIRSGRKRGGGEEGELKHPIASL